MPRSAPFRLLLRALQAARRSNHDAAGMPRPLRAEARGPGRRGLLLGAASLGAFAPPASAAAFRGRADKVAILGGGLAGLAAAWHLRRAGIVADVYEGSGRLGGRVLSETGSLGPGLVTELGGELINSDHADMLGLIENFGLGLPFDRLGDAALLPGVPASAYLFGDARVPERRLARALRPLAQRIAEDSKRIDQDYDRYAPPIDRLSVAEYLDQQPDLVADPVVRSLITASIRTEYGVEPDASSALQLVFNLPTVRGQAVEVLGNSDERLTLPGGNSRIIAALATALPGQIHLKRRLVRLARAGGGEHAGYRLVFADGNEAEARRVIIAIPFPLLRQVTIDLPLRPSLRRFIARAELGRNEKIGAGFRDRPWRQPGIGFALEAWTDLGFSEAWDAAARQPAGPGGALTFYMGGQETGRARGEARDEGMRFLRRLDRFVPGLEGAGNGQFLRTDWQRNPWSLGAYTTFPPGMLTGTDVELWEEGKRGRARSEVRSGRIWFAGEHLSDAFYGFMNGAAQTGRLAAQSLVADLPPGAAPA